MAQRRRTSRPAAGAIRVVVVEPREIVSVGVREILDRESDIEVVANVATPAEAIRIVDQTEPYVVLVDVDLPGPGATEETRRLRRGLPGSRLVVMGGDDSDVSIAGAVEVGAAAHVASKAVPAELVATIRRVADGADPLKDELRGRPDVIERIVDSIRDSIASPQPRSNPLSPRELDILAQVAAGGRNRDIAASLGLSEQTVKNHLTRIMYKLGVPNRTHAVTYATRQGWLALDGVTEAPTAVPRRRRREQ